MRTHSPFHSSDPLPNSERSQNAIVKFLKAAWHSERHVLVMLGAAAWTLMPLDLDWIPIAGWIDDGFAIALFCKHATDLACGVLNSACTALGSPGTSTPSGDRASGNPADDNVIDAPCVVVRETRRVF